MEEELKFEDIINVLRSRKKIIIMSIIFVTLLSIIYSFLKSPVYEAKARVRLPGSSQVTEFFLAGMTNPWNDVPTQLEIIKSINVAKRVINKLGLRFRVLDKKMPPGLTIDSVYVKEDMPSGDFILEVYRNYYLVKNLPEGKIYIKGPIKTYHEEKGLGLKVLLDKKQKVTFPLKVRFEILDYHTLIKSLSSRMKVSQEARSFIAVIRTRARSPELAKKLADTYANAYVEYTLDDVRYSARVLREFLQQQVNKIETQLKIQEDSLKLVKEKFGVFAALALENSQESTKELLRTLTTLEMEKSQSIAEREEAKKKIEILKNQIEGKGFLAKYRELAELPGLSNNPQVQELQNKIITLEIKKAELMEKYTEKHPEIQAIENQIEATRKNLQSILKSLAFSGPSAGDPLFQKLATDFITNEALALALEAKVSALDKVIRAYEKKISFLPTQELTYARLKRKIEATKTVYNMLLQKLEETRIQEASQISDARVLDYALLPKSPISPKKKLNIVLGLILGTMLGIFGAFIAEYLDNTVKSAKEVEEITSKPVLSIIPLIQLENDNNSTSRIEKTFITHFDPLNPISEAFKKLQINIRFLDPERKLRIFSITSSIKGEGKSTVACNIAIAFANAGEKVLLIDGDIRRATLHDIFNVPREPGFSDLLVGHQAKAFETQIKNLYLLPAGTRILPSLDLFNPVNVDKLKERINHHYNVVIVDTPPILPVAEALSISSLSDATILVVRSEYTDKNILQDVAQQLKRSNVNFLGTVLNAFNFENYGYYARRYYYEYYGRSGVAKRTIFNKIINQIKKLKKMERKP